MKKIILLTLYFVFVCSGVFAQELATQTIRGKVHDAVTKYPLVGALVGVQGRADLAAISNTHGEFEIASVPLGRQTLEISYIGYQTRYIENILIVSGKQTVLDIALEEDAVQLSQVIVFSKNTRNGALNEMASVSARAISVEQTERFAGSLGDPARMVANYAGVSSKDDSRNDIVIRGNSPGGVLWRLEGVEVPNPNHFGALGATGGPVSMINNNLLATSDFLMGAFPAEYGNALAGAFDLHLRPGNSKRHEFIGQVGFNGFEAGAEGPVTKKQQQNASYLLNFRYSTLDVMHVLGFDFGTGAAVPQYKDLTYNVVLPTEKMGRFNIFGLWGDSFIRLGRDVDTTENSYNVRGTATDFGSSLGVYGLGHRYYFNPKTRLHTVVSYQNTGVTTVFDSIKPGLITVDVFRQRMSQNKISVNQQIKYKKSSNVNMSAGYIYDYFTIDFVDSVFVPEYDKFHKGTDIQGNMQLIQAYGQLQYKFGAKLSSYAGVHSQFFDLNKQFVVEPRFGVDYKVAKNQGLTLGYGIHHQTQPKELYFQQFYDSLTDTFEKTNEQLAFTKNTHYIVGYYLQFAKHWRLKSECYYQYLQNVPVSAEAASYSMLNAGADFTIPNIKNLENKGTGTNKGIELTLERFLEQGYYLLVTASLFDSKYRDYNNVQRNTTFNGNYILNALGGYEYAISQEYMLTLDVKSVFAGGKRYIPIDLEASKMHNETRYDWNSIYEKKYDPYFRTDIRIGLKQNGKRFSQEWGLDLQNVTNYKSIFSQGYDVQKQNIYNVYQQGFMPMMLYRIRF